MKKIEAFIKAHRLDEVVRVLCGIEGDAERRPKITEMTGKFLQTVRIEVFCRDELAQELVGNIGKTAHTGLQGDGKIYVIPAEQAVRISTGERGEAACLMLSVSRALGLSCVIHDEFCPSSRLQVGDLSRSASRWLLIPV